MDKPFETFIPGRASPQGSKRHVGNGIMVEASKHVKVWRDDVRDSVLRANNMPKVRLEGAVILTLAFVLQRPKTAPKKRVLSAAKKPDLDKLIRAVMDALKSADVYQDDSQVTTIVASKRVAGLDETPGVFITIQAQG